MVLGIYVKNVVYGVSGNQHNLFFQYKDVLIVWLVQTEQHFMANYQIVVGISDIHGPQLMIKTS